MAYDSIRLEKGLYTTGKSFTGALESIDPSENYTGTALEGLDAYQRQLKRFGIRVSGRNSDPVEKFFRTSDSAALFPEYVSRAVRMGMEENDILSKIIATKTVIDSMDYRAVSCTSEKEDKELVSIAEGASVPQTAIRTKEDLVRLNKRGRMLVASYEAVKFQRLDLFTVALRQIGAYIARAQAADAVDVICAEIKGTEYDCKMQGGTPAYQELLSMWSGIDPYRLNTIVGDVSAVTKLLALPEFRDAAAGLNFHATGKMITPFGAQVVTSGAVQGGALLGLDSTATLEMVQAGEIVTDFDKLIDRQLERAVISTIAGFSVITGGSSILLSPTV